MSLIALSCQRHCHRCVYIITLLPILTVALLVPEAKPLVCWIRAPQLAPALPGVMEAGPGPLLVTYPSVPVSSSLAGPCLFLLAWVKGPSVCLAICLVSWRGLGTTSSRYEGEGGGRDVFSVGAVEIRARSEGLRSKLMSLFLLLSTWDCSGEPSCACPLYPKDGDSGLGGNWDR